MLLRKCDDRRVVIIFHDVELPVVGKPDGPHRLVRRGKSHLEGAVHRWCTLSGSVTLWIIPVAILVIALYLWTPKTGKGIAIYGAIVLAMLIVYFALRG